MEDYQDEQMSEKNFSPNVAPSLSSEPPAYKGQNFENQFWATTFD